ncbi:hypothetical protein HYX18_01655 [Candidatus Woesearchaeota archaeon]|nr:hypothetical protein [Candidatus Woesearchaeota archaeon]
MKKFPGTNMRIFLAEMDLNPLMQQISRGTNRVIERINTHMCYPGELATRLISLVNLEFADRIGHCAVGTTNGTEIVLGEFVIGAANECEPIADIYKSQVFDIGEILGISRYILERNPINSTFGTDKIHTYFAEIPDGLDARAVYSVLDPVVHHLFDLKLEPSEVARRLGHSKSFVDKVARRIRNQDHRRRIPFFCLEDKIETTKSSIESIPQEDVSAEFRKMYSCQ